LPHTYEAMFLLDNQVVREDWKKAKAVIADTLAKHGATLKTLRRFQEARLAYTIKGRKRGTYYLGYYEMGGDEIAAMRREFELNEKVLRYLMLRVEEVPAAEFELASAENAADYTVPAPPPDDMAEPEEQQPQPSEGGEDIAVPDLDDAANAEGDEGPRTKKTEEVEA
jgi:ribosomal protein S6